MMNCQHSKEIVISIFFGRIFKDPSYQVYYEEEYESMEETSINPHRDSCRDVLKNIHDDTSEDSYEAPPKKE